MCTTIPPCCDMQGESCIARHKASSDSPSWPAIPPKGGEAEKKRRHGKRPQQGASARRGLGPLCVPGGCRWVCFVFFPASGYRNNDNLNNHGSNGNYWSSSLNTSNENNARNLNFNSGNVNTSNNNNRYNGFPVRPVAALAPQPSAYFLPNTTYPPCLSSCHAKNCSQTSSRPTHRQPHEPAVQQHLPQRVRPVHEAHPRLPPLRALR